VQLAVGHVGGAHEQLESRAQGTATTRRPASAFEPPFRSEPSTSSTTPRVMSSRSHISSRAHTQSSGRCRSSARRRVTAPASPREDSVHRLRVRPGTVFRWHGRCVACRRARAGEGRPREAELMFRPSGPTQVRRNTGSRGKAKACSARCTVYDVTLPRSTASADARSTPPDRSPHPQPSPPARRPAPRPDPQRPRPQAVASPPASPHPSPNRTASSARPARPPSGTLRRQPRVGERLALPRAVSPPLDLDALAAVRPRPPDPLRHRSHLREPATDPRPLTPGACHSG
jgi:hypothetical protein